MAQAFVVIDDPVHHLLREVTRHLPLVCTPPGEPQGVVYAVDIAALPEPYFTLAVFHSLAGMSLDKVCLRRWRIPAQDKPGVPHRVNYFDAINLDRRCARDLRLKVRKAGPCMVSAELLAFGAGALRARNDDLTDPLHQRLWSRHGRLHTRHEQVSAVIRALHRNSQSAQCLQKESFDSTNVIYGDAFGELEQLWDRRADTDFLEQVALSLRDIRRQGELTDFLHPPLNLAEIQKLHLRSQALWKTPPPSARSLLRRLEYILSNTVVDSAPQTLFRQTACQESNIRTTPGSSGSREWERDSSGYDGWLKE